MNADLLDLNFPVFDDKHFPPPVLTIEEWLNWLDEFNRLMITPERFEQWIMDERHCPVNVPFVMD